jgi:Tfp pilus assembly protein PilF
VLLGGVGWAIWRQRPEGFAGAWFFLILAPTSSFIPVATEVAAEHRMYLPLAAVIAVAVAGGYSWLRRAGERTANRIVLIVAAAIMVGFTTLTDARNRQYESDERIWTDTVQKRPFNPRAHNNLAVDLIARGDLAAAEPHLRTAVQLDPRFAEAQANLGVVLCQQGRCREGILEMEKAIALDPGIPHGERDLAEAFASQGRIEAAISHFDKALEQDPDDVFVMNRLAWIRATSSDDALRNGAEGLALAGRAVTATNRRDVVSLDSLAAAQAEVGRFDEAVKTAEESLSLARAQGDTTLVAEIGGRLALYRRGKPFRQ